MIEFPFFIRIFLFPFLLLFSFFFVSIIFRNDEEEEGVKNILLLIMSMATSGVVDLRPNYTPGLIVLPTFTLPSPSNSGLTLRNIDAFRLLFQIFVQVIFSQILFQFFTFLNHGITTFCFFYTTIGFQCRSERVCEAVVDAVHNIYASDAVNYFIADKECALSQMIEHIGRKSPQIQVSLYRLQVNDVRPSVRLCLF